jgi:uncharacterized protein YcaQ
VAKRASEQSITGEQAAAFRLARHHLAGDHSPEGAARRGASASAGPASCSASALAERVVDVVRDTAGIQAQVMSSAEMAIWTRRRSTTREEIHAALWERREVVKTSAMRLTLHLIPARDLPIYIAAMRPSSMATLQRWHARIGAKPDHVRAMIDSVVEALADGPRTQQELIARAKRQAGKGVRAWLDHAWSAVRPAVIEGAIVYGPPRGAEATFVRADTWLGGQPAVDVSQARAELLRRFLSAFGPATAQDFSKWSGIRTSDAKHVLEGLRAELVQVSVDGAPGWIRRADLKALASGGLDGSAVRLLGAFDSFLLAHATKAHLVDARFYKRVYRAQGWISPVVLRGGTIVGVWFPKSVGKTTTLRVELFARDTPATRRAIEREAEEMSTFLGLTCSARFR